MKDFLRKIRADFLFSSVLCILLGIVFIVWKDGVIDIIGTVLAIGLVVVGVVYLSSFFLNIVTNGLSVLMGVVVLAVGIWFLIQPPVIVSLIPIVIGVVLAFHGVRGLKETLDAKKNGLGSWGFNFALSVLEIVFGAICIFDAFGVMEKAVAVVGILLVLGGLSNIWIAASATHAARDFERRNATVDVEFVEDDHETDGI
ncbi:MAG: DUF308 domain-containing protein [Muribaculaceae bacterium]|nr:DUF308 domain-containing protein [Roseburia sp.]MCM1430788.1 DUF308 domain-containing protein [Muribaculaceae bacterium]MCM1492767.1 DUF308 domain-containing protein [Muribaculaceae bacterium]